MFQLHNGVPVFGSHQDNTLGQLTDVASRAARAALMADGHYGYIMPVGGVTGYDNQVSVAGVGFDIACGNAAIRTDLLLSDLSGGHGLSSLESDPINFRKIKRLNQLADEIFRTISFGLKRLTNTAEDAPVDHPLFNSDAWQLIPSVATNMYTTRDNLQDKAREQLGTVGTGNHYVDVLVDKEDRVWVGVHFGSRGFGYTVANGFLALSQNEPWGTKVQEVEALLDLSTPLGNDYWSLMTLAGEYAYAGREWVTRKVVQILGGKEIQLVHNHHNFAWKERHAGRELVVVRKGATPAFPRQLGFVGGSMGDDAVILIGAETRKSFYAPDDYIERIQSVRTAQEAALFSTVHGAGRLMSRAAVIKGQVISTEHTDKGMVTKRDKSTIITREMMHEWLERRGVILRGADVDESPHAYRRLTAVLEAQGPTVEILHTLRPFIVCMAPKDTKDPFKD